MRKLLDLIFGNRKDGKCRWWQHEYDEGTDHEFMVNTGSFINNAPIQVKYGYTKYTCKKCRDWFTTDSHRMWN